MAALPEGKTARELGFKEGDRFRVLIAGANAHVGESLRLTKDLDSRSPLFENETRPGTGMSCAWMHKLEPFIDRSIQYNIGDKVCIGKRRSENNSGCLPYADEGTVATVREIDASGGNAFGHKQDERIYIVDGERGYIGRFAASELEPCNETPIREETELSEQTTEKVASNMPRCPFKPGDRVRLIGGDKIDEVVSVPGMPEYDAKGYINAEAGFRLKQYGWKHHKNWALAVLNGKHATNIFYDEWSGGATTGFYSVGNMPQQFNELQTFTSTWADQVRKPKKEKTIMSNIKDKIKVLAMSDDNKALHEAGFINADGDLTDKGQDALEEVQYQSLRPELVKLAKDLTEDDKKKEKKSK